MGFITAWTALTDYLGNAISFSNPLPVANQAAADTPMTGSVSALNSAVTVTIPGRSSGLITIGGSWSAGTIAFEKYDGANWIVDGVQNSSTGITSNTTTANGTFYVAAGSYAQYRARVSSALTGTATVQGNFGSGVNLVNAAAIISGVAFGATPAAQATVENISTNVNALSEKTYAGDAPAAEDNPNGVIWVQTAAVASTKNGWTVPAVSTANAAGPKGTAGKLRSLRVVNTDSTAVYAIVYNATSAPGATPTAGNILDYKYVAANGGEALFDYGSDGLPMSLGVAWGIYTTYNYGTLYSGGKTVTSIRYA